MNEIESLSARLHTLERHLRWVKRAAIAGCLLITAVAVMAQVRGTPGDVLPNGGLRIDRTQEIRQPANATVQDELRAHQITLVDENGRERASLVSDNSGSVFLIMSDRRGKTRINLSVANDGPSLVFLDPSGQQRTILGSTTLVGSHVNDNGIAEMAPPSSLVLFDGKGKLLFRTP
jgi:hypothetical protein